MKQNSTFSGNKFIFLFLAALLVLSATKKSFSQVALGDPSTHIYGLTSDGAIYEIQTSNAKKSKKIKSADESASSANGLAYSTYYNKFYYFNRNISSDPQQFVSYDPSTNKMKTLAKSSTSGDVHTGSITLDGKGYYDVDVDGILSYYNIETNKWKKITSKIVDQYGIDVDSVIRKQSSGDLAIDGNGNIWIVTSNNSNYGVFKISAPLPTETTTQLTVTRVIAPTTSTPTGKSFAGIAFNTAGQIFMSTKGDDRLYLLQNATTLVSIGKFDVSDVGNDLTSLNFPTVSALPVTWISFTAAQQNNNKVDLEWKVTELQNKGFYIQHSTNGSDWKDINFVASRNGEGTDETYSYSYAASFTGKQYYRIKQVDIDGKESFSIIRVLNFSSAGLNMAVWPNPATNVLNIDNNGNKINSATKAQLFSLSGQLCMERQLKEGLNVIDISALPAGAYIVRANNSNEPFIQRIIKR